MTPQYRLTDDMKKLIRFHVFAILFFLLWIQTPTQAQVEFLPEIDTYIEHAVQEWEIPGLAIAIVKDEEIIFSKGYGFTETGKNHAVDDHTLFAVASDSKAFTATLLGMLVDEGKIRWNDRVIDYLPHFQMYDPYVTRDIRIRDLLTHRSGLPTFGGDHLWIGNTLTRDDIINRIRYLEPTGPFRAAYQYQNLMFLVAGEIVPAVTGKSWDQEIKDRILVPLGMEESNTSIRFLRDLDNVALPHEIVGGTLQPVAYDSVDAVAAAAGINSNVLDMTKWMRFNMNDGVVDEQRLISSRTLREIHTIQFALPVGPATERDMGRRYAGYGLGWSISEYRGKKTISHGGGLTGMISLQTMLPEERLGIMVMTNFAPNSLTRAVTYRILDTFLDAGQRDWAAEHLARRDESMERRIRVENELEENRARNTHTSLSLAAYAGTYHEDLAGYTVVRVENGALVFDYNPRHIGDLRHWHHDTFRVTWRHPIFDMPGKTFLTFELDEKGEVTGFDISFYDPIHFKRVRKE